MLRWILLVLFIPLFGFSFKEKYSKGVKGDFVVYRQGHQIVYISIYDKTEKTLIIEEIHSLDSNPKLSLDAVNGWVEKGALNATQWILYEMHADTGEILEAYCPPKKAFINFDQEPPTLAKLYLIEWDLMPDNRRKVSPKTKKVWSPPKSVSNKPVLVEKSSLFRKYWDDDNSPLSGLRIDLHFDPTATETFPYMIDIQNKTHPLARFFQLDQGNHSKGAARYFPRRFPEFQQGILQKGSSLVATICCPKGFAPFTLSLEQVGTQTSLPIEFTDEQKGETHHLKGKIPKNLPTKGKKFRLSIKTSGVHQGKFDSIEVFELN
jgi:hypothetical protein